MKSFNVFKPSKLIIISLTVLMMGLIQKNIPISIGASMIILASLLTLWLGSEPKDIAFHKQLPKDALRRLSNQLHHSQIPLFEPVMQALMAREHEKYQSIQCGTKINGEPITLFDKKIDALSDAFSKLKQSGVLYQKRLFDDRDRAITLLVFFEIFLKGQNDKEDLQSVLKKIPAITFKLLRQESYRLFDLPYLLTGKGLVINLEFIDLFSSLSLFNNDMTVKASEPFNAPADTLQESMPCQKNLEDAIKKQEATIDNNVLLNNETQRNSSVIESTATNQDSIEKTDDSALILPFISWLEKRISSGNQAFSVESQKLIVSNTEQFGDSQVFVTMDVLGKYQSRAGVETQILKEALFEKSDIKNRLFIERDGVPVDLAPCQLTTSFDCRALSEIKQGELL